ncbi:unnamed protein product, partial [Brugia timori]|uniref:Fatty acid synthase n=1 Tax=Brugia timori TaxID=42155 RepID=A0A0R3Q317_9BILA
MDHKYDPEDIPDNAKEWNNYWKIPEQRNECNDQGRNKMTNGQAMNTKCDNECDQNKSKNFDSKKKGLKFEINTNTGNAITEKQEECNDGKQFESIEWNKNLQIPGLLINISRKCTLALSSFQILSDTFQQYYKQCCDAFHICHNDLTIETIEQCGALTYAFIKLLFHIGYNPERIIVSGIDTLMMLAAKNAIKLDDACFAWKMIDSLITTISGDKLIIAKQINAILSKIDINFQNAISLINIEQLIISNMETLITAILTNEMQNEQFLNDQLKSFMIIGSTNNNCLMKHIENFDDFIIFITHQNNFKLFIALQKILIEKKTMTNLSVNEKIFNVKINLNDEKYLFAHLIHNCNILSAATLLITIFNSFLNECYIFKNVTFLFPVIFTSENDFIHFKIQFSANICTVTYENHQCVTFQFVRNCQIVKYFDKSNNWISASIDKRLLAIETELNAKLITEKEFYTEMEKYYYQYYAEFRSVKNLLINGNYGTVELTPSEHFDVLIDGAMQAIVFIYIQQFGVKSTGTTLVPFHIQQMIITDNISEEEEISIGRRRERSNNSNANILAFVKVKLKNGQIQGSFQFITDKITVIANAINFSPIKTNHILKSLKNDQNFSSTFNKANKHSSYQMELKKLKMKKFEQLEKILANDQKIVCVKSIACRLPKNITDPAEFWNALKIGELMTDKIPYDRINGRDNLAYGQQYGIPIRCGNFLSNNISYFDAKFFGISRSEAEKIDPQQRLLLECIYECMENAGMIHLHDAGFFIGFMSNEYANIVKCDDAISMLGSSASIVSGRLNYLFGSNAPAITIDTACSSSLVALQIAIDALKNEQCKIAIVAGVNLILTEQSIGQRANGHLLADDGLCRSFDALSNGYGRADGCVALLLTLNNITITTTTTDNITTTTTADNTTTAADNITTSSNTTDNERIDDCMIRIISTTIGHNGKSISLTAPNGFAQEKLLQNCLSEISEKQLIDYWEAHGTGTIIGDAIELKALQANLQHQCLISTAKTHFGHSEAAAGATGLAKILLQFKNDYIPVHGSYQFLQNLQNGNLYLPIIGEEWMCNNALAGISSFGIGGTNAMAIIQCKKLFDNKQLKMKLNLTTKMQTYLCPLSAKCMESLNMLMISYQTMLENSNQIIANICSTASLHRNHMHYRAIIIIHKRKIIQKLVMKNDKEGKGGEGEAMIGLKLSNYSYIYLFSWFHSNFPKFRMIYKFYLPLMKNFAVQQILAKLSQTYCDIILAGLLSLITFLNDIGIKLNAIYATDNLSLLAAHLITGKLAFTNVNNYKIYSNMQIFTKKISATKKQIVDRYKWYKLDIIRDQKNFEYELMEMIGISYLHGNCINWKHLYSTSSYQITLPNYQFKRESYWITKNSPTIDHWLIGRLMKEDKNECIFINQISKMTNAKLLMAFKYNGQMRFSFGICCDAIIQALQLTFFTKNISKQSQYYFHNFTMNKYLLKENDWMKTTITKYSNIKYHIKLTCATSVICEANIILNVHETTMKRLNINKIKNGFISKPNFYEILNNKGIIYDGIYQTIIRTSTTSSNEIIFVAKCCYQIFHILEAIIQSVCYCDILNPNDIYGDKKFIIKNLNFHQAFLTESTVYLAITNRKIIVYSGNDQTIMISVNFDDDDNSDNKCNEKIDKMKKCRKEKIDKKKKSDQFISTSFVTYQECIDKVRHAVEDIRKDNCPISNKQLSASFIELGLDSLAITDLANRLNTIYFPNLQFSAVDLFNYSNIKLLTDAIYKHKISSKITDNKDDKKISEIMVKHSGTITTLDEFSTSRESRLDDKHTLSSMLDDNDNYAYTQIFFKKQSRNDCMNVIITDKEFLLKQKSDNQLIIIVNDKMQKYQSIDDNAKILHFNRRNSVNFKHYLLSYLNDHKKILIKFALSNNFSLKYLVDVLLQLTQIIIIQSNQIFIFSSKFNSGYANAFALGFAKSLCAELYPKVQYEWNFILQKISNFKNYTKKQLSKLSVIKNDALLKERWLITGGLGGIGWQMAKYIGYNRRNISHLFLLGRKEPNEMQNDEMKKMRERTGVDVRAFSVDLTCKMQVQEFFEKLPVTLTSIIHSAGCIHDKLAAKQTHSTFRLVIDAKCNGLLMLDKLCRLHPIKHFITNSSISALIGNRGQCNYSAANAFIDEIMLKRRAKQLPATIINWGNWLETGMAIKANKILNEIGFIGLKTQKALAYLQIAIDYAPERMIIAQIDIRKILHYRPDLATVLLNTANDNNIQIIGKNNSEQMLNRSDQLDKNQSITDNLVQWNKNTAAANKTGINEEKNIDCLKLEMIKILEELTGDMITIENYQQTFMDLGLDSFKIYQFVSKLTEKIEIKPTLNVLAIFEHPTINQLLHYIASLYYRIKEYSDDEITERIERNCHANLMDYSENIAKSFKFFTLHSTANKKLDNEQIRFYNLHKQLNRSTMITCSNKQWNNNYLHIIWGFKYKLLQEEIIIANNIEHSRKAIICFMISGQGSQIWNMGRQLSSIFPFFRQKFDETLNIANEYMAKKSVNIRDVIYHWHYRELLYKTNYAQPIIYCFAYSLAKFYEYCGVNATYFVGHSIGEIVAYTLANQISLIDALKLVIRRGEILEFTRGMGKMIAVNDKENGAKLQRYSGMHYAAINSDKQIILSGDNQSAKLCIHYAQLHHYSFTIIDDCYPFHSSVIDSTLLEQYKMECKQIKLKKQTKQNVICYSTGELINATNFIDNQIIASINSTVYFKKCIETLRRNKTNIWLEIGNGEILTTFVRSMINSKSDNLILSSISNNMYEMDSFIHSLCQLQNFGVKIKWEQICNEIINTDNNSTDKSMLMKKLLNKKNMKLFEEHRLHGAIILPAAFIIVLFVEYTTNLLDAKIDAMKRMNYDKLSDERRMIIFEALRLEKRITVANLSKINVKFIKTQLLLTDSSDNNYCSCRLGNEKRKIIVEKMKQINALKNLKIKCKQFKMKMHNLSHQLFYEIMRKNGLQYGPNFQILREIYRKDCYISALLINDNDLIRLIDGSLQLLSAALLNTNKLSVYIPFAIDDIIINYNAICTKSNYFHAYGIITKRTDNIIKGSVIIYDNDSEIIILHNVTAIDISANKSIISTKHCNHSQSQYSANKEMNHFASSDKCDNTTSDNKITPTNTVSKLTDEISTDKKLSIQDEILEIEIISYIGQFPNSATDCASLWNNLKAGINSHSTDNIQKFQTDITMFEPSKFGITPKEAIYIDPQQRILLEMTQKLIEKTGLKELTNETGVFIGVSSNDFAQKAYAEINDANSYLSTGTNQSALAGRIAYWFNLNGPTMVIDTACSSFASALTIACDNIKQGNCRMALVGAINIILNLKSTTVLQNAQMLSETNFCKVFDVDADGYVRSDGAAMILIHGKNLNLKSETFAIHQNDFKFTIEAYGMRHNGRSNALTVPNGISEYELMSKVCKKRVNKSVINWVEAHATGTSLGDPIEAKAILNALADNNDNDNDAQSIHITSVKSSIGHCEAVAGAASLIMVLEACNHNYLPSMQHFKLLNRNITNDCGSLIVPVIGEELPNGTIDILINSFGFSGTNTSIVLRRSNREQLQNDVKRSKQSMIKQMLSTNHSPSIISYSGDNLEVLKLISGKLKMYVENACNNLTTICAMLQNSSDLSTGKYRIAMPIKQHTQKWMSFVEMFKKSQKWTKIIFKMEGKPEPAMIAELYISYRSFRKIFLKYLKIYKCTNNFTTTKLDEQNAFEYISKISLLTFLFVIGVKPLIIIATNRIDQIIAKVIRRNYQKGMSYECCNFEIQEEIISDNFDCILSISTLQIEKPTMKFGSNLKKTFSNQFVEIICQLYVHFIDINWKMLNDQTVKTCLIPDAEYSKKKYWPFTDCNMQINGCNSLHTEIHFSNLQLEMSEQTKNLESVNPIIDQFNSNNFDNTKTNLINSHYLYKLVQKKCLLPDPEQTMSFIAINLTDTTTILGQQAIFVTKINDNDDIVRIKKQFHLH